MLAVRRRAFISRSARSKSSRLARSAVAERRGQRWSLSRCAATAALVRQLAVEAGGNVCVALIGAPGADTGIAVASPAGEVVDFVATDDPYTTNICCGGDHRMTAYVTPSGTGRLVKSGRGQNQG